LSFDIHSYIYHISIKKISQVAYNLAAFLIYFKDDKIK